MLIDIFNEKCSTIASSYIKVGDESMSVIRVLKTLNRDFTSLVLYLLQDRTAWDGVQDGCLICNSIPHLP